MLLVLGVFCQCWAWMDVLPWSVICDQFEIKKFFVLICEVGVIEFPQKFL